MQRTAAMIALVAVAFAARANAHPDSSELPNRASGTRLTGNPVADERILASAAHEMAACLVKRRGLAVKAFLAAKGEADSASSGKRLMSEAECFASVPSSDAGEGRGVVFPRDVLRGMLAEQLLKRDKVKVRKLPVLKHVRQLYVRPWFPATFRDVVVNEMATCVAEVNPAGTYAVVETEPYSAAERTTIGSLAGDLGRCLRAGAKLLANRQALRAALAEALYQRMQPWAVAPPLAEAQAK